MLPGVSPCGEGEHDRLADFDVLWTMHTHTNEILATTGDSAVIVKMVGVTTPSKGGPNWTPKTL